MNPPRGRGSNAATNKKQKAPQRPPRRQDRDPEQTSDGRGNASGAPKLAETFGALNPSKRAPRVGVATKTTTGSRRRTRRPRSAEASPRYPSSLLLSDHLGVFTGWATMALETCRSVDAPSIENAAARLAAPPRWAVDGAYLGTAWLAYARPHRSAKMKSIWPLRAPTLTASATSVRRSASPPRPCRTRRRSSLCATAPISPVSAAAPSDGLMAHLQGTFGARAVARPRCTACSTT